jgi:hypothetical protein
VHPTRQRHVKESLTTRTERIRAVQSTGVVVQDSSRFHPHCAGESTVSHTVNRTGRSDVRCWDARLDPADIQYSLSSAAAGEAIALVRSLSRAALGTVLDLQADQVPALRKELDSCRRQVERDQRMVLIDPVPSLDFHERRMFAWIVAALFGDPLVQNADGDRLIAVYARSGVKRVADGARYHQTREGGAAHTDNVNTPEHWEYLVFSCIRPAWLGGESIMISGFAVHQELNARPDALEILRQPFWWEYRGISDDVYQAPVVTYDERGEPRFRYLRRYLESAHQRAGQPLTPSQVWALDTLDAILELSHLRFRVAMHAGHILVTYDSQVLHARTSFSEPVPGAPSDVLEATGGPYRFFDRVWVRKRHSAA